MFAGSWYDWYWSFAAILEAIFRSVVVDVATVG